MAASPSSHQVKACHPDQGSLKAHSLNVGRLLTCFKAALHSCCMLGHHNWLPCLVGGPGLVAPPPPPLPHFSKKELGKSFKGSKIVASEPSQGPTGLRQYKVFRQRRTSPPLTLHLDGKHACFCLRSAESGIDKVIGEGIAKVRQFLSYIITHTRRPRNWQNSSNPCSPPLLRQTLHLSLLPNSLRPSNGFPRTTPDALPPFQHGQLQNQCPLASAVAVFSQKPSQPWLHLGPPRDGHSEAS